MNLENYYFKFFTNTKCAVFILKNSLIHYANPSSLELFGYNYEEILSLHPSELSPEKQYDGEISIIKADRMIKKAIEEGGNIFEWQHLKKDKTVFWTEIVLTPVKHNGEISIIALIKDISKRKSYQNKLSSLIEEQKFLLNNIVDFIYKVDKNNTLTYVSASIKNISGYTKEEWKKNYKNYVINFEKSFKIINETRKNIFNKKLKNQKYTLEIKNKKGKKLILELMESYYDEEGNSKIIGLGKNITERYQNEMILLKSQKMELISKLSSGLVHQFNNNLSVILGNIDLLKRKVLDNFPENELINKYTENIKTATKKANETLNHLLTITNKQSNALTQIDLNELALDTFSILRNSFSKAVELKLNLYENNNALMIGDLSQLKHVLLNIFINSYQAILKKKPLKGEISLKIEKTLLDNQNYWLITITDNGIGIPEDIFPMIFEPFFTTKDKGNDLGLGLTSSKNIIEAHKGKIEVKSKENKGTTVKIYLPETITEKEDKKENKTYNKNGKYKIHLIDDEPLIITTAKAILEEFGHEVITSLNGKSSIKTYRENFQNIDLVILDMDMPGMSGKEVFYELKKINENVKVIISSGYENDNRLKDIIKDGVKGFLPKPYGIYDFINKINFVLNN